MAGSHLYPFRVPFLHSPQPQKITLLAQRSLRPATSAELMGNGCGGSLLNLAASPDSRTPKAANSQIPTYETAPRTSLPLTVLQARKLLTVDCLQFIPFPPLLRLSPDSSPSPYILQHAVLTGVSKF